jgi:2-polyprenyl-3-methyl-5-hydroxy-6-metoxy-1,4-benzoquinol methylase
MPGRTTAGNDSGRKWSGSAGAFDQNWKSLKEGERYYFRSGTPRNQIEFAFQNHWRVFRGILGEVSSGRVLEVGCGRGSISAFFADAGFDTHLLDTSEKALQIARLNFELDRLKGDYICGNALELPYRNNIFDVVVSIGLLEHFSDVGRPLLEQMRVLRPGGLFLGYVVPERKLSVQTLAMPINALLRARHRIYSWISKADTYKGHTAKTPLYRNNYRSTDYLAVLKGSKAESCGSFGMFPLPLISHSPGFPFSVMAPRLERNLIKFWKLVLRLLSSNGRDPWLCPGSWGLAFLVWAKKRKEADA